MKRNRTLLAFALCVGIAVQTFAQDLMITGVMDGDLPGGSPKMVELYARNDIADLSQYALRRNSGGTATWEGPTPLDTNYILPAISLSAGQFYYAVGNSFNDLTVDFDAVFPAYSAVRVRNFGVNSNGDDPTGLFYDPTGVFSGAETLIDVFGEFGDDGSGTDWEHLDGYAYSKDGRVPSATFNILDWDVFNGALDTLDAAGHADAFPDQTYVAVVLSSPPTITEIDDQSIPANGNTGPLAFTIGDFQDAASALVVTATSDDPTLIPNNPVNLTLAGADENRTITVTPAAGQEGIANIEVVVTDLDMDAATNIFQVTVGLPTISTVANQTTPQDTATPAIPFTVNDAESAPGTLTVVGTSSDQLLVQDANIVIGNPGGMDRTVTITPESGQVGTTRITLNVTDGSTTNSTTFAVTVFPSIGIGLTEDFTYGDGDIETVSSFVWTAHSGANDDAFVVSEQLSLNFTNTDDVHAFITNPGTGYTTNSGIIAYAGFVANFSALPSLNGSYFAHFWPAFGFNYRARLFASTSGAETGMFRIGISNGGFDVTNHPQDLALGVDYNVVIEYNVGTAETRLWINPASPSDSNVAASDVPFPEDMYGFAFRQASGIGAMTIDNLRISTSFNDVLTLVAPTPIPLDFALDGGDIIFSWADSRFNLQAAPAVTGVYTNIPGATSPHTNAIGDGQMYFRLVAP